ncbi:MAG: cyclic nucleotide-binding domain-containing protein [Nitriliruptorales bacterium]|nr:cyclic nucleotide-binding domain-containing protein [Nitriliruptorales bacterium]
MLRLAESDPKINRFRSLPLFEDLFDLELRHVAELTTETTRRAGTSLMREGGLGLQAIVILEGEVDVISRGEHVTSLGAGDVVGEMAVLNRQRRTADVVAATDVRLLVFDPSSFLQLLADVPTCLDRIRRITWERGSQLAAV